MSKTKEEWRQEYHNTTALTGLGKIAEAVRRLDAYRQCQQIFVSPAPSLTQIRINALLDGKKLLVPSPGLKEGFYLLLPYVVPFPKLSLAVSLKGMPMHGQLLRHQDLSQFAISLLITEALAVDNQGHRLGDGNGFFDLACAILKQCGALAETPSVWATGIAPQAESLPFDTWDVTMHGLIGPQGGSFFLPRQDLPDIDWQLLPKQRIKKITPLWKEWEKMHPVETGMD
jgi:5-formyltetrahydrofolate cyclo-ligase